ncbi:hypothetical protein ACFWAN_03930 [Streptomyces mirabilis]|uniref:hypothetical protein n=1 Tax=Streptomyces mirabilis TaxID=68239 RepID=UPI00365F15C7
MAGAVPGQVTTLIADTRLEGPDRPVEVLRLAPGAIVRRARVYALVDPVHDVWEARDPGIVSVVGDRVLATGPEGSVRVIVSASQ